MDNILYTGLFRSPTSWAKVNRKITLSLINQNNNIFVYEQKGFLFNQDIYLDSKIKRRIKKIDGLYNDLCFIYPPVYKNLKGNKKFSILTIESTKVPEMWKNAINRHIDTIIVPSEFCKDILIESNINIPIRVIPFGVDHSIFNPKNNKITDKFRFLFIGTPHYRKGISELIDTFKDVFFNNKDVELYIKMPYLPINNKLKSWEIANIPKIVSGYENIIIDSKPIGDKEIADLIASANVVIQPSYSEGFGLSILEAMAMEKLIITTLWSGESEFVTNRNSLIVKNDWIDSGNIQYGEILKGAKMKRPDIKHLKEVMEYSFLDYCELSGIRANALITSKKYTWEKTAGSILKVLQ